MTERIVVPQIGDKLRVLGAGGFYHYGIYVSHCGLYGEDVVHNNKNGGVQLVQLDEFAGGQRIALVTRVTGSWYEREIVARRALDLLGTRYDLINFNCEHFANLVTTGKSASPQFAGVVLLSVLGLVAYAAAKG